MNQTWVVPLIARIVGYLLMTVGAALWEALSMVIRENNWSVALNFLAKFQPKTLASFVLMLVMETAAMLTMQERWTELVDMGWYQSIGVAFMNQALLQQAVETIFKNPFERLDAWNNNRVQSLLAKAAMKNLR